MPTVDDYDPNSEDDKSGFGTDGTSGSSSGGGALFGGASKQPAQTYTPWDRFTSANSEVSDREAGKLQSQVGADVDSSMNALDKANRSYGKQVDANYTNPNTDRETRGDPNDLYGAPSQAAVNAGNSFRSTAFNQPAPTGWGAMTEAKTGKGADSQTRAPTQKPVAPAAPISEVGGKVPELNANAVANGPQGPKDLESSMSPDAWTALTGKISNANAEATALGKGESNIQALLSQNGGAPASKFDAALVGGTGQQGFQDTANKFGNFALPQQLINSEQGAQDAWGKMTTQADATRATQKQQADNAATEAYAASQKAPATAPVAGDTPEMTQWKTEVGPIAESFKGQLGKYGDQAGFDAAWNQGNPAPDVQRRIDTMAWELGLGPSSVVAAIDKMTPLEYQMFMMAGIVPQWMQTGKAPNGNEVPKGVPHGWPSWINTHVTADSGDGAGDKQAKMNEENLKTMIGIFMKMLSAA